MSTAIPASALDTVIWMKGTSQAIDITADVAFWKQLGGLKLISFSPKRMAPASLYMRFVTFSTAKEARSALGLLRELASSSPNEKQTKLSTAYSPTLANSFHQPPLAAHGVATLDTELLEDYAGSSLSGDITSAQEELVQVDADMLSLEERAEEAIKEYAEKEKQVKSIREEAAVAAKGVAFYDSVLETLFESLEGGVKDATDLVMVDDVTGAFKDLTM